MSITPSTNHIVPLIKKEVILSMLERETRIDGRKPNEYRPISIELGYAKKADGSASVRIGDTAVLAGVKVEDREPFPDVPDQGNLIVSLELPPIAHESFEVGPPDENAIELSRVVDRSIRDPKALDLSKLVIVPNKKVWNVWVDIYVIDYGGNILDTSTVAAIAALYHTKLPRVEIEGDTIKILKETKEARLPMRFPVFSVSVGKIGRHLILDPSTEEEGLVDCKISFSYTPDLNIVGIQKMGNGGFTMAEIDAAEKVARSAVPNLFKEFKTKVLDSLGVEGIDVGKV